MIGEAASGLRAAQNTGQFKNNWFVYFEIMKANHDINSISLRLEALEIAPARTMFDVRR